MNDQKANGKNSEEPVNPGRRKAILASGLGVAAAAGSTIGAVPSSMAETRRDMDGKTALITGGARGIGLASAEALAKAGANIILFDVAADLPGDSLCEVT